MVTLCGHHTMVSMGTDLMWIAGGSQEGRTIVLIVGYKAAGQKRVERTKPKVWSSLLFRLLAWPWQILPYRLCGQQHPAWPRYGAAQL